MKNKIPIVMLAVLTVPLAMYFVPFSYAATTSSSYQVIGPMTVVHQQEAKVAIAHCNAGDYATGGGFNFVNGTGLELIFSAGNAEFSPDNWEVNVFNPTGGDQDVQALAMCQTPISVAGIGVPEFGQLYLVIALGAVVFFLIARYNGGKSGAQTTLPSTTLQ